MSLRFWGVRGSLPTPGPRTVRHGGNTLCVELRCGPHLVILDGGTGARELGLALPLAVDADILLSHCHLDHVCGLPFFRPMFDRRARLAFWGGGLEPPVAVEQALLRSWQAPLMPGLDKAFRASLAFHDFVPGDALEPRPGLQVQTLKLRHPGGSVGYRVRWGAASVCYITDYEHGPDAPDPALVGFVAGTDVLITDASYTDAEYASRIGWGHSTWQEAVRLADAAGAGQLVLFHHDPDHDDDAMDEIGVQARSCRAATLVAREGLSLTISP